MTKRKQNLRSYNRKAKQREDEMAKSLASSIASLFNARIQRSLPSSQVEEASGEDNEDVDVTNEESSEEEVSGEDMDEVHEKRMSEGCVDVGNDEFREEHTEDPIPMNDNLEDGGVNEEASSSMLNLDKDVDVNYDPGLWGSINDTKRVMLVKKCPIKILKENDDFPKELNHGRQTLYL